MFHPNIYLLKIIEFIPLMIASRKFCSPLPFLLNIVLISTIRHQKLNKKKKIIIRNKETKLSLFKVSIIIPTKKEANHKILVIDYGLNTI